MKIFLQPYTKTFSASIRSNTCDCFVRKGFLIGLYQNQKQGWGDVCPLPGFSQESYQDAWKDAMHWKHHFKTYALKTPSVAWAVAVARSIVEAKKQNISLALLWAQVFQKKALSFVKTAVLYSQDGEEHFFKNVLCLKVKVGRQEIQEDLSMLCRIVQKFQPRWMRLDANRSWTFQEALRFCVLIREKKIPVEFLEQPCINPKDMLLLSQKIDIPLALDESLYRNDWDWEAALHVISFCVLKPSLIGSLACLKGIVSKVSLSSCSMVVSSIFESEVGRFALYELAKSLHHHDILSGLGTAYFLR